MTNLRSWTGAIVLALLLGGCISGGGSREPLETVDHLDLERYMGEWYVIANIPYFAERGNVRPRVIYAPREDGRMDDLYFYRKDFGKAEKELRGKAWVVDEDSNAVWKTRFIWPFTFDYYVLAIDPDYRYVAVGHPSREYAWIMAREPRMSDEAYGELLQVFERQGWDTSEILKIPQFPEQQGRPGFQG